MTVAELAKKLRKLGEETATNFQGWKSVATSPKLRTEFVNQGVKPLVSSAFKNAGNRINNIPSLTTNQNIRRPFGDVLQQSAGQIMQRTPSPKLPSTTLGRVAMGAQSISSPLGVVGNLGALAAGKLGSEAVRSYGRTFERTATPEGRKQLYQTPQRVKQIGFKPLKILADPGVETALNLADIIPVGKIAGAGLKTAGKGVRVIDAGMNMGGFAKIPGKADEIASFKKYVANAYKVATKQKNEAAVAKIKSTLKGNVEAFKDVKQLSIPGVFENKPFSAEATQQTLKNISDKRAAAVAEERLKNIKTNKPTIGDLGNLIETNTKYTESGVLNNPPPARGGLRAPAMNLKGWKDGGVFRMGRETLERNLNKVAGKDAGKVKEFLVDASRNNEAGRAKFLTDTRLEIRNYIKNLGIKSGSKEDALVQRFGEGLIDIDSLKKETPKWQEVVEASQYFRNKYDNFLDLVNKQRERFDYTPIPKRQDYFRHFQEIGDNISSLGLILREQDLPTGVFGISDIFAPGKPFSTTELQRRGGDYTESAIKGMDNYLDAVSRQIFHLDTVQRGRALEKYIQQAADKLPDVALPNFWANLHEWTNLVSGKKARVDRAFEGAVGRKAYGLADWLRKRTGANMVGGNLSSAMTNFIPFTQTIATTKKPAVVRGLYDALVSPLEKAGNFFKIGDETSKFLTRRFPESAIALEKLDKAKDVAGKPFQLVDRFVTRAGVAAKYYEKLSEGLDPKAAMKAADDYAAKVYADRSVGQLPNLMSTRSLGFITQFQTEVNNQASFLLKDIPEIAEGNKARVASMLTQFAIYSYLFNSAYEKVTGRRPQIDPIQSGLQMLGLTDDTEDKNIVERGVAAMGSVGQGIPFAASRLPVAAALPSVKDTVGALGNIAEGNYKSGVGQLAKEVAKPAFYLAPAFGGGQLKKTLEGVGAYQRGYSKSTTGMVRFPVEQTPANLLRTGVLGQWATPEGQKYLKSGTTPLGDKQSERFKELGTDYYNKIINIRDSKKNPQKEQGSVLEGWLDTNRSVGAAGLLPTNNLEVLYLYEGALSSLGKYGDNKLKSNYGLVDKTLEEYQMEADEALEMKRLVEKERPDIAKFVKTKEKDSKDYALNENKKQRAKKDEDYKTWLDIAKKQLEILDRQMQDPTLDEVALSNLEERAANLIDEITKYEGYGGSFKKGKKITIKDTPFKVSKPESKAIKVTATKKPDLNIDIKAPTVKMSAPPLTNIQDKFIIKQSPAKKFKIKRKQISVKLGK